MVTMDLHYGRDDFADENRLVRTLSRDRAKDMASDYEPAQSYAVSLRRGPSCAAEAAGADCKHRCKHRC